MVFKNSKNTLTNACHTRETAVTLVKYLLAMHSVCTYMHVRRMLLVFPLPSTHFCLQTLTVECEPSMTCDAIESSGPSSTTVGEVLVALLDSGDRELVYSACGVLLNVMISPDLRPLLASNNGVRK